MARGGSKLLTAIISFLLGFLFALLVEVGAIFGVYWFIMNKDLDSIMSTFGLQNVDEEGNHRYINTDPNNGGVTNVKELIAGIQGLLYEDGEFALLGKSFDDIENLVPATNIVLGIVYDKLDGFIELDREEFESTPMSGLAQVLTDSLMNVKTAALMDKLGMDAFTGEGANQIIRSLIMGSETEYATIIVSGSGGAVATADETEDPGKPAEGETPENSDKTEETEKPSGGGAAKSIKLPVLYDIYISDPDLGYMRETWLEDSKACPYPSNLGTNYGWLDPITVDGTDGPLTTEKFTLNYVPCRITENGIEEAEYFFKEVTATEGTGDSAKTYRFTVLDFGEDTDFIVVDPDKRDDDGNFVLNYAEIYAAKNDAATGASDRFIGYSYLDEYARNYYFSPEKVSDENTGLERWVLNTISGKNYFRDNAGNLINIDALTLGDIVTDPYRPLDSVLVATVVGKDNEVAHKVFGNTTLGAMMRGEVDFDKLVNDLDVNVFINNISPDNKVMAYIVHKVTDLHRNSDGTYSAIYDKYSENEQDVTVLMEDGWISKVVDEHGIEIPGVKVNEVAALTRNMTINLLMDVEADQPIMTYVGYGVTGATKAEAGATDPKGKAYDYTGKVLVGELKKDCYIKTRTVGEGEDAKEIIVGVWYIEDDTEVEVGGTKVNEVSNRVGNFTKELTLGDVLGLKDTDNQVLKALSDTLICDLDTKIESLTVSDIFTQEEIQGNAILRQLVGTPLSDLATEIDKLLIQTIYSEEVYKLPEEQGIMEVVDFVLGQQLALTLEKQDDNSYDFERFGSGGALSVDEFNSRGDTVLYTQWSASNDDDSYKVIGYYANLIYYKENEDGALVLVDDMTTDLTENTTAYDDALGHLTEAQFNQYMADGVKLYSYGDPKGMWKLVLNKKVDIYGGSEEVKVEKAYTINNFNNMVAICANNVNDATLRELKEAGIIKATDENLNKTFNGMTLGDMKLSELINAVISMAT